jgi:hypothetical protein
VAHGGHSLFDGYVRSWRKRTMHPSCIPTTHSYQWSASSLLARYEVINCGISALAQCTTDPFRDEIMDFAALLEGGLAQRFVHRFGQVKLKARMGDIPPWPVSGLP